MGLSSWTVIVLISIPGFFFNFQPSEPYLTRYLHEDKNFTSAQLNTQVWPADTYTALIVLIPVGLLAESRIGYLPVVIAGILLREGTRIILIFGQSLALMTLMQVLYACGRAVDAIYFSFPFLFLPQRDRWFAVGTGLQYALYHLGNVLGSALAQALVSRQLVTLRVLFYISWGATSLAIVLLFVLCFLPKQQVVAKEKKSIKEILRLLAQRRLWGFYVVIACMAGWWNVMANYYQQNLTDIGLPKDDFGYVEIGLEGVFILGSLAVIWTTSKHHNLWQWLQIVGLVLIGVLMLLEMYVVSSWVGGLVLTLLALLCYKMVVQGGILVVAQSLQDYYAIVFTCLKFVGLLAALIVSQTLVALHCEESIWYYLGCMVLLGVGLIAIVVLRILYSCYPPAAPPTSEQLPLLSVQ